MTKRRAKTDLERLEALRQRLGAQTKDAGGISRADLDALDKAIDALALPPRRITIRMGLHVGARVFRYTLHEDGTADRVEDSEHELKTMHATWKLTEDGDVEITFA